MVQVIVNAKTERVLKKLLGVDDITPFCQNAVDTAINHKIETSFKNKRSVPQMIDDLDKM